MTPPIKMNDRIIPYPRLGLPRGTRITFASDSTIKGLEKTLDDWLEGAEERNEILSIDYHPISDGSRIVYTASILYKRRNES